MRSNKKSITGLVIVAFLLIVYLILRPYYSFLINKVHVSPFKTLLFGSPIKKVDDTINILILGIGGGNHDGPNLSDTMIVASYNLKKNRLITIGIPRDIWSDTLRDKINSAYAYGEAKVRGGGFRLAKAETSAIIGMPIQYAAVIDFSNFEELIDYVGGVDVNVKRSFTDKKFPIEGKEDDLCGGDTEYKCRYETVSFKSGQQHMNGKTALKFVRSRYAEGEEGSDFARNQREQIVMAELKSRIIKIIKGLNIKKISDLYDHINSLVSRDISNQDVATILKTIIFKKGFYQKSFNLIDQMFIVPDYRLYDGKYVLIPANKNFDEIHNFVSCALIKESEDSCLNPS